MVQGEKFFNNNIVLICTLENGQAVQNISSTLKTYVASFCETTEKYPVTFF